MDFHPSAILAKTIKVLGDQVPRRQIVGQIPLRTTRAVEIEQGVDEVAPGIFGGASAGQNRRHKRFEQEPLGIRQIAGVGSPFRILFIGGKKAF